MGSPSGMTVGGRSPAVPSVAYLPKEVAAAMDWLRASRSPRGWARAVVWSIVAFESHDGDHAGGIGLVLAKAGVLRGVLLEQAVTLLTGDDDSAGPEGLGAQFHGDLRVGHQVVIP